MGINPNGLRFLLFAKAAGVDFTRTATIGRLGLHLSFEQLCDIFTGEFNYNVDRKTLETIYSNKYCEGLLEYFGASNVHSFDYSGYESSTHIHDFNHPLPAEHFDQYTAVIDGGSLEHVFNFPAAIKNCMQMIKIGGHFLGMSPTNNHMGHGFYQFSPELYFRIFNFENGFKTEHILLLEGQMTKNWYKVPDPVDAKCRVGFTSTKRMYLLILAIKLTDGPIFSIFPLQSDYGSKWNKIKPDAINTVKKNSPLDILKSRIPLSVKSRIKSLLGLSNAGSLFSPFDPLKSQITLSKKDPPSCY